MPARWQAMVDYMAARTAFFDEFFAGATDAGIRQVVILAAGLDSRAWRLSWPVGVTVYELDQPKVLEFKSSTLREHGAQPQARNVGVAVDLRQNWPQALRGAGFDPSSPSAWSAEGLLPFLPASAQDLLFERIDELSAVGSRVAVEATSSDFFDPERLERQREQMRHYREVAAKTTTIEVPDFQDLWYVEEHADVGGWLRAHGFRTSEQTAEGLMARCGRHVPENVEDTRPRSLFVTAER
jgi:methyltransferase (TIGR00027 family)